MPELVMRLRSSTSLRAGWYDPGLVDPLGLRATEIKGLWRWWARAFVGGALYEMNCLRGRQGEEMLVRGGKIWVLLKPSKKEVELIAEIVGKKLGLGLAVEGKSEASMFSLYTETVPLGTRYENKKEIPPDSEFELHVEWTKAPAYLGTALKILLVALQLTGIGRGSRRCKGSLDVVNLNLRGETVEELQKLKQKDLRSLIEESYREVREISKDEEVKKRCEEIAKESPGEADRRGQLPPLPVILKNSARGAPVTRIVKLNVTSCDDVIRNFLSSQCPRALGHQYEWFLGLPRKRWPLSHVRRASPIMLAFHKDGNVFGQGAFMSIFLSGDWPQKVELKGQQKPIVQNASMIIDAYNIFWGTFQKAFSGRFQVVWP